MDLSYYPGCSLESSAREYHLSSMDVCSALGINLVEIEDWACCGASSAHAVSHKLAHNLPARNIALAQEAGHDLAIPCAACYNRVKKADYHMRNDLEKRAETEDIIGFKYNGQVRVMSLLEAIAVKAGAGSVKSRVTKPLKGLSVACYYGCLLVRPAEITGFDDPENPRSMDDLVKSTGAQPVKWSYKTECCGGNLSLTTSDAVREMVQRLLDMAREAGAGAVVTSCPLCQMNLEVRRNPGEKMPVFYFTELIGLAMDLPGSNSWLTRHIVDPMPLLRSLALSS